MSGLFVESPRLLVQVLPRPAGKFSVTGHGEVDVVTVGALVDTISAVLDHEHPRHVDVNLAEVTFMDSSGLNWLVRCRSAAARIGCEFTVSRPQPIVRRLFAVTGLLDTFGLAAR
jgi:anti-sigma B factor antagonist